MRIVSFDIETTDLKANMGTLLCASFQEIVTPGYYKNHHDTGPKPYTLKIDIDNMNPHDPNPDKELAMAIKEELLKYHMVLTWNGKMFDRPFLNARLLYHNELPWNPQFHVDLMYYAGFSSNRIGSKRLASVQQFLKLSNEKTALDWDIWKSAMRGDKKALNQVVKHCEIDVGALGEAYWRLLPYIANIHR